MGSEATGEIRHDFSVLRCGWSTWGDGVRWENLGRVPGWGNTQEFGFGQTEFGMPAKRGVKAVLGTEHELSEARPSAWLWGLPQENREERRGWRPTPGCGEPDRSFWLHFDDTSAKWASSMQSWVGLQQSRAYAHVCAFIHLWGPLGKEGLLLPPPSLLPSPSLFARR